MPAAGFSLGFERIVDLVELDDADDDGLAVLHDKAVPPAELVALQRALLAGGETRVRLERRAKNAKGQLDALAAAGFRRFASVRGGESVADLAIRPIG